MIHNCDCLELLRGVGSESATVVITDPPYGINYQNNYTKEKHARIVNDEKVFDYEPFARESFRILRDNTALFSFTGWSEYPHNYYEIRRAGFSLKEPIIGQKRASGKTDLYGTFQTNSDWCIFAHKGHFKFRGTTLIHNKRAGTIPNIGRQPVAEFKTRFPSAWFGTEYPWSSENSAFQNSYGIQHPTIKGRKFIEWLILLSTDPGDLVVDPFVGSGTTAVAAIGLGRRFIGCDISKEYCELAEKRLRMNL